MQSVPRRMINRVLHLIAKFGPGASSFRPFIHKMRGVKMNGKIWIGEEVFLENNYPDHIEIGDEAQIAIQYWRDKFQCLRFQLRWGTYGKESS